MSDDPELTGNETGNGEILTTFMRLGKTARPVQYTVVDGRAQTEGCIIIGSAEEARNSFNLVRSTPGLLAPGVDPQGSGIIGEQFRWPDATIIFEIAPGLGSTSRIDEAMQHWRDAVGIKFEPRVPGKLGHENYIRFISGGGCSSAVGMRGGMQELVLGPNCTTGNCIHELGHAFGLWHEQSRNDRDAHVRIHFEEIQQGREYNFFQRLNDGIDLGGYDAGSIMHYPLNAFAKGDKPTIELLNPFNGQVGQRTKLSDGDKAAVRSLYGL